MAIDTIAWEVSPATAGFRRNRRALWAALRTDATIRGDRAARGDVRAFVLDLLTRIRPTDLTLVREFPGRWTEETELLLRAPVVDQLIARALPVRVQGEQLIVPQPRALANDATWRSLLDNFGKAAGQTFTRSASLKVAPPPVVAAISLAPSTYNGRTESAPCLAGSCTERDVRAWRLAAKRWFVLVSELRAHLLGTWGPKEKWPQLAATADLAFDEAQKLINAANDSLAAEQLANYIAAQKYARLAVHGYQLGKGGKDFGGLLFELVEPTFGRFGPITGFGNRTLGRPCTGLLDVCTDTDLYGWEYVAKSENGAAAKLREAVVLVFGEDAAAWPPLVRLAEFSYTEAQAVLNGDLGWSDSTKIYSFADAQALVKDAMEVWARAIDAKTGKNLEYEAPDPNKDPGSVPEPPKLPEFPELPDLGKLLRDVALYGGLAVGGTFAAVYLIMRRKS